MAAIDTAAVRVAAYPPRTGSGRSPLPATGEAEDTRVSRPAARKSALMQALELNDDLSGLVSSMRRGRMREETRDDVRGQSWQDHVLDPKGPEKLASLRELLHRTPQPDPATLRALIETLFPEPGDALAVLRTLIAETELEATHGVLRRLHDTLLEQAGTEARAGLNVALKARLNAPRLQTSAQRLRRTYLEFLADGDALDAYTLWIDLYGFEHRARVVEFIEQALAADMYALDPSCSRIEFGHLLQRVRQLTSLRSADAQLMAHCWQPLAMARIGVDPPTLLRALLGVVREGGGVQRLFQQVFAGIRHALDSREKAELVQGVQRFLKALPHGLWSHVGLQVQAIDEIDALLDAAIRSEQACAPAQRRVMA